jgi:4a-hydroxytetrahydrobiopterin dehydratase
MNLTMSRLLPSRTPYRSLLTIPKSTLYPIRTFTTTSKTMVLASEISPSPGSDLQTLVTQTTALVDSGRWTLTNNGKALERQFRFKTFKATWVC